MKIKQLSTLFFSILSGTALAGNSLTASFSPITESYHYYDEMQQPTQIPALEPLDSVANESSDFLPEEESEATQSGAEIVDPLSKITQ